MALTSFAAFMLDHEAQGLLTRLERVQPFALIMPSVTAANVSQAATTAIDRYLLTGRMELSRLVKTYVRWLRGPGRQMEAEEAQRRLSILRLKFNAVLTQFDIFADALGQRSEYQNGVWLAGLDELAADALTLPGGYFERPPMVVYLDRGIGAAIRRARTRLPGGGENPVAIVKIPRERMVGSGIASSLVHEVGHQGAALLGLIDSMRLVLQQEKEQSATAHLVAWDLWQRWISEILADFWSIAKLGVAATQGLMGVVSLPRAFVFRINVDDPHPLPWVRVRLSTVMGQALYPHPQWAKLAKLWDAYYPQKGLDERKLQLIRVLEETMPRFVALLLTHRPESLSGRTLREVFALRERSPDRLAALYDKYRFSYREMKNGSPIIVFAVLGQAKQDGRLKPVQEGRIVARLLTDWALDRALRPSTSQIERRPRRPPLRKITATA